jgi:N-methylhydantoinase B
MATGNLAANIVNTIQSAFAQLGDGFGLAEGGCSMGIGQAVVSGKDYRRNGAPYINQLFVCFGGGPAGPNADGWVNYGLPQLAGLIYRDSVEIAEMKQPLVIRSIRLLSGTCGAGRYRGSPASEAIYGPKSDPMTVIIPSNCQHNPPRGVNGGHDGILAETYVEDAGGSKRKLPNVVRIEVHPGEWIGGVENSGAGYGSPLEREPQKVLTDVMEGWETTARALEVYGVVLVGTVKDENLRIDTQKTIERRKLLVSTM